MGEEIYEEEIIEDNSEIAEDISDFNPSDIVVYSRDWTIETIYSQIRSGNIDLNPKFQRRNAWTDDKRSKLIESIIIGYPVPEIVLAEDPKKKRSFIVIDGKQRLLTVSGFIDHAEYEYWNNPKLKNLTVRKDLNSTTYDILKTTAHLSNEFREFNNSSLRCTVITSFTENDILYDIFYRLNSGSVPLSTQELRQVLNRGDFANYLIVITNNKEPIHDVLNLDGPDKRLRDTEILLRLFAFLQFAGDYTGNLKKFLDDKMKFVTDNWAQWQTPIEETYARINECILYLKNIFGDFKKIGRKTTNGKFETRFNRVLFEVEIFYFSFLNLDQIDATDFVKNFITLCDSDAEFRSSIEATTKTPESYRTRYNKFQDLVNTSFHVQLNVNPFH